MDAAAPAPAESEPSGTPPLSARVHAAVGAVTSALASTLGGALSGDSRSYGADAPERVLSASFGLLEPPSAAEPPLRCLFLTYATGWQCWSLEARGACAELVSVRDSGAVSVVLPLPQPERGAAADAAPDAASDGPPDAARPLVAVAGPDAAAGEAASSVRFYSVRRGEYVATRPFRAPVLALRATSRLVVVALDTQLYGLDASSLEVTFSVITFRSPAPAPSPLGISVMPVGPIALGPRWLAYAAAEAPTPGAGRAAPQRLSPGGGGTAMIKHYATLGGKHLASNLLKAGDKGYRAISAAVGQLMPGAERPPSGAASPSASPSPSPSPAAASPLAAAAEAAAEHGGGAVLVRDVVSRAVVAHFRAHASPVSCLVFDPSGALLLTSSLKGSTLHVFSLLACAGGGPPQPLYRLHRGWSPALIQNAAFAADARWLAVSTAKGTTHLYALNPAGGPVSAATHAVRSGGNGGMLGSGGGGPRLAAGPGITPAVEALQASARVRAAGDGWVGAVAHRAAQAAAAAGLADAAAGAMAASLRSGGSDGEAQRELLVFAPSGSLTRYALRPRSAAPPEAPPPGSPPGAPGAPAALAVELVPLERWDVRRSPSWPERCEPPFVEPPDAAASPGGAAAASDEWDASWLAQAELFTTPARVPAWGGPQLSLHVLLPGAGAGMPAGDAPSRPLEAASSAARTADDGKAASARRVYAPAPPPPYAMATPPWAMPAPRPGGASARPPRPGRVAPALPVDGDGGVCVSTSPPAAGAGGGFSPSTPGFVNSAAWAARLQQEEEEPLPSPKPPPAAAATPQQQHAAPGFPASAELQEAWGSDDEE